MTGQTTGRVADVGGVVHVLRFLRANGFPRADRRALCRARELGPIAGTPDIEWAIKPTAAGVTAEQIATWCALTDAHRVRMGARVAVLVLVRSEDEPSSWPSYLISGRVQARSTLGRVVLALIERQGRTGPQDGGPAA